MITSIQDIYYLKNFSHRKVHYELNHIVILTLSTARTDRDEGEVGHRQNQCRETTLTKIKKKLR